MKTAWTLLIVAPFVLLLGVESAIRLEARRVMPEPFEIVKIPLFVIKDMDHHITEVEQDPFAFAQSSGSAGADSLGAQFIFQVFSQRLHVASGPAAEDDEVVSERRYFPDIENNNILTLAVRCNLHADIC